MKKVILGGTFDILHKGHEALLKRAIKLGGKLEVGLSSDEFAQKRKGKIFHNFEERKKNLEKFLLEKFGKRAKIVKIEDIFGPTLKEDFDYLVVSEETFKNALKINKERKKLGKRLIEIVKIEMVLAEDGKPISCTRIRNGEIDKQGNLCVFCKIAQGKQKAFKIYENKKFLAFLDKNPRNPGHTLVIPKKHFKFVWDVPCVGEYFEFAKKVANAIKKATKSDWIIAPVSGEEVWHAHLHLIPRFKDDNFYYIPPSVKKISEKGMKKIQRKIKLAL